MGRTRAPVPKSASPVEQQQKLPFGSDFQKSLLRLLTEDPDYARMIADHLHPQYFESEVFAWVIGSMKRHRETYGAMPSLNVLANQCSIVDSRVRPMYSAMIDQIREAPMHDVQWMKDQTLDFVKRCIFVRTFQETKNLYNGGKVDDAYDLMMERMGQLIKTTWEPDDESSFFDTYAERHTRRQDTDPSKLSVSTGIHTLDTVLNGGLSIGELGIWVAYAKSGKSTMLINHGVAATRLDWRKTAHFVFEGSRSQVEARYDACFTDELYSKVKRGEIDAAKYDMNQREYTALRGLLRIRGCTDSWDYSVTDIWDSLQTWKREGWEPEVLIVDYGDLICGRDKNYPNEREKQKAAFRDLKSLANRGYALWTASQAQRPEKGADERPHLIHARDIADCYEKVRVADFLGSINMTVEEKKGVWNEPLNRWDVFPRARLYAELYRDSAAHQVIDVVADFQKMTYRDAGAMGLGYGTAEQVVLGQQAAFQ